MADEDGQDDGAPPVEALDEYIQSVARQDERIGLIEKGIIVGGQLRDNETLKILFDHFEQQAMAAMLEFATASLGDANLIKSLQAKVYRATECTKVLGAIIRSGKNAEDSLKQDRTVDGG